LESRVLENIKDFITENDNFIITSHVHSDGDSIGSELAIAEILRIHGKNFYIYNNDSPADYLDFLTGIDAIKNQPPADLEKYPNLFVLDCAFSDRVGQKVFENLKHIKNENTAAIDHHPNPVFNDKCYIDSSASSTGELIYNLVEYMSLKITPNLALALFTAIFTDTLGFRQTNTTSRAFLAASVLFDKLPFSHYKIIVSLYESKRLQGLKLLGKFIETVKLEPESMILYGYITRQMFETTGAEDQDIEDFVNHLRSVENVRVACLFRQTEEGDVKINLRAKDESINLVPFAKKMGGGGHPKAAGFSRPDDDIQKTIDHVLPRLKEYIGKAG